MQRVLQRWGSLCAVITLAILCVAVPIRLSAQADAGTSVLSGMVLDPSGKAFPNAAVTMKNEASGEIHKVTADSAGHFSAAGLAPGSYTVEVSAPNFATARREKIQLSPGATEDVSISLSLASVPQTVTVEGVASVAAQLAPVQSTLEARSAVSQISPVFVRNFTSPVADYTEVTLMAPGTFSVSPNGVGLGDSKTFFRGFKDGLYTMTYDGIPFNDTNDPTHHSWAFFPSQWIGETDFDRSPGTASTIGPTNFGGSINLKSREEPADPDIRATAAYGSFNTRLLGLDYDSGQFGKSSLSIDLHQLLSDGYQTYNYQKRVAGELKYQFKLSDKTTFTAFAGVIDLWNNTPNTKGPTRAQVSQFGNDYLLSGDPSRADYYGYNFYHIQTDFEYIGLQHDLGHGWKLDNKAYTYRYWNKQNYNGTTTISTTSGTDKLNGYRKVGDILSVSRESKWGVFRSGLWYEWAYTDRYQYPTNPRTWVNSALPNFHERFRTQSWQPFAEYEFRATRKLTITGGLKLADYGQNLNQFADNGKTVGPLGGVAFVTHHVNYHTWLPAADARYLLKRNWSVYGQFAMGNVIPPSSVFDVKNALVSVLPKPTTTKTYQAGSVWKNNRVTVDVDGYYSRFQNAYASSPDPATGEPIYFLPGDSITKGVEAEGTVYVGAGVSLYLNGTMGNAKYATSSLWVANAPRNTETAGLTYQRSSWDLGFFNKRIGQLYNDNGTANQAVSIDPFNITNLFLNYTVKNGSYLRGTQFRLSVNNVFDQHNIVGVTPASTATSVAAPGDFLTLLAGRSVMLSVTFGWAPRR